jgi:hypothetical protein
VEIFIVGGRRRCEDEMNFEWNDQKNRENIQKHGDEEIDYSDIPPLGEEFFQRAKLYAPGTHTVCYLRALIYS